ncbi:MAG: ATP-binding protein [Bacteriovoracaceae bacterium]
MRSQILNEVKILIVDDRPENLFVLQASFKDTGYTLIEAHSGKEALEQAKHHDFACILLDVQMPQLDGFETAMALRSLPRTETTPIIFITAIDRTEEYELQGYFAGAVDYLFKPINTNILRAKVSVFVDLFLKSEELKRQKELLEVALEKSREAEELKKALRARDEFLVMASHELKTPITPLSLQMQTFIDLFENDTFHNVDRTRIMRMLHTSMGQIERLSRLIFELVDVSRLSSNRLTLNKAPAELNSIVRKVLHDFEPEIKNSGSLVTLDAPVDVQGYWDSFRIEQIVINLLTNALKYGDGKPITISTRKSDMAEISVSDQGLGISPEDQSRIFERYERAVPHENFSGLGLGLYIAKQIIYLHGGEISLESEKDKGSTFKVRLPL